MGKKILFIEDEPDQVMLVKERLEENGFMVIAAMDGEEGLKKVYSENPHLILLDIIMPRMDGCEVCRQLKHDDNTKDIPIIGITASGAADIEEACRVAGADDFIRKPYDSGDLIKRIKHLIGD